MAFVRRLAAKFGAISHAYLKAQGALDFEPPSTAGAASKASDYDQYVSDPAHPVPFVPDHGFDMDADYMARDQRFTSTRRDVLTYRSQVLTEDVTVVGPIRPHLEVSTSGTDSDWIVKLIDVHPSDGFEERYGAMSCAENFVTVSRL